MHSQSLRGRNLGLIAFAFMLMLGTLSVPLFAGASTFSAGFQVEHTGETIQNDLYVAAFRATVSGDVQGDVTVAAGSATLDGNVGGSVHVLAGTTAINGDISGTLYVAGGLVALDGSVDGNVVIVGGRLDLNANASIGGDLIIHGAQAQIDGSVDGKLYGSTLLYNQNGGVNSNVELQADRIRLGDEATIGDDFRYQSQTDANISVNATVGGESIRTNATPWSGVGDGALAPFGQMLRLVWSLIAGAVLIAFAPRIFYRVAELAAPVVAPGIWGTLGLILVPIVAMVALVSVFLLPVGLMMMVTLPLALYLTQIVVSVTIGRAILPRSWRDGSRGFLLFAMVIGTIIIGALRMAPVPFLNAVVMVLVTVWGFGAIIMLAKDVTSEQTRSAMNR